MAKAKYLEVANELRKRIKQGIYNKQEPLPDQETFEIGRASCRERV